MNKTQAIVFFGIILTGLGASLYYFNVFGEKEVVEGGEKPENEMASVEDPESPDPEPAPPKPSTTETADPKPKTPDPEPTPAGSLSEFNSPEALVNALLDTIRNRDVDGFLELAGEEAVSDLIRPQVEGILKDEAWGPDPERPISELAKSTQGVRWTIHLKQTEPSAGGKSTELYADLVKPYEDKRGWTVKKIALPLDFAEQTGLAPASATMPSNPGTTVISGSPDNASNPASSEGSVAMPAPSALDASDAIAVAHAFSRAVVGRNFTLARQLTDPDRVTDERVAALMIALEEGSFDLRAERPLVVTLSRDDLTWVLTRVDSRNASSEFALEMGKPGEDDEWRIHGLTFSKLIAALANQAGAGGVAYAPIVADPQGGDSLVLYFEFDDAGVSPRTARQLDIVADILSADTTKRIRINGHADAKGSDQYNEVLGIRRASAIRAKLIEFGVPGDQIITESFGEARPRRPNFNPDGTDNPANRSQNRRAEVYLDF